MRLTISLPAAICGKVVTSACSLALLVSASEGDGIVLETSNAVIEARDGAGLRVVFAAEGQPALLFKATDGVWDWRHTSKLVIPVENPGGEPVTLPRRIGDEENRSMTGKISIAPGGAGGRTLWPHPPS